MGLYPVCQTHWPRLGSAALRHIFFVSNKKQKQKTKKQKQKQINNNKADIWWWLQRNPHQDKNRLLSPVWMPGGVAENYTKKQKESLVVFVLFLMWILMCSLSVVI